MVNLSSAPRLVDEHHAHSPPVCHPWVPYNPRQRAWPRRAAQADRASLRD